MNFPPVTWFDWGALLGIVLAGLALVVGVVSISACPHWDCR